MTKLLKLSVNRFLYGTIVLIVLLFSLLLGLVLSRNLEQLKKEALENFAFRSELFKDSIDSNLILGDYVSTLKKAELFFSQSDVEMLQISLIDGTSLVNLNKVPAGKQWFEVSKQIGIADGASGDISRIAAVKIAYDLSHIDSILHAIMWQGAGVLLIFLGASAFGAFYLSKLVNQPLRRLSRLVSGGDLQKISSIQSESRILELETLESAIASMGGQLTSFHKKEVEHAKSLAVAQVAAQISHDLRAPLATIERLLYLPSETTITSQASSIKEALFRIGSMIDSFRNTDAELMVVPNWELLSLSDCFDDLSAKADLARKTIVFEGLTGHRSLLVDGPKLKRAITNLASNALDAARSHVSVRSFIVGSDLCLSVTDDGAGVPDEILPKLFQRGATYGKADGTGLGLAYVRQILRGHGGDVSYRREGGLTTFECILPNVVGAEQGQALEKPSTLDLHRLHEVVRKVAICLEPKELSESVLAKLTFLKSKDFIFISERKEANIVVSNIESIMFEVMESDEQEHVSVAQFKGDEAWMIDVLKLKFNLNQEALDA